MPFGLVELLFTNWTSFNIILQFRYDMVSRSNTPAIEYYIRTEFLYHRQMLGGRKLMDDPSLHFLTNIRLRDHLNSLESMSKNITKGDLLYIHNRLFPDQSKTLKQISCSSCRKRVKEAIKNYNE